MELQGLPQVPIASMGMTPETLAVQGRTADPRALANAAKGFESMFMSLILKEMRQTLEPGGLFGADKSDLQGGLFDFFLGQHLAEAGGLGVGAMLKRAIQPQVDQPTSEAKQAA